MAVGRPNNQRVIRERREKILFLLAKGHSISEVARELRVTPQTVNRDMRMINKDTYHGLFDMAKATLPTLYMSCVETINQVIKECWLIHNNKRNKDPTRILGLNLIRKCGETKFSMFQDAPAIMQLESLNDELRTLKETVTKDMENTMRNPFDHSGRLNPYPDTDRDR